MQTLELVYFVDLLPDVAKCGERLPKVYKLPIDSDRVKAAVERSKANQSASSEIPDKPQTGVHCIIEDLVARGIISVD